LLIWIASSLFLLLHYPFFPIIYCCISRQVSPLFHCWYNSVCIAVSHAICCWISNYLKSLISQNLFIPVFHYTCLLSFALPPCILYLLRFNNFFLLYFQFYCSNLHSLLLLRPFCHGISNCGLHFRIRISAFLFLYVVPVIANGVIC